MLTRIFVMVIQPMVGQDLPIIELSQSHADIPQLVGFLWTSDQCKQKALPDNIQQTKKTDIHALNFAAT
jgi:hypothetical protein